MKKTNKLIKALEILPLCDHTKIYQELNTKGYVWDTKKKRWYKVKQTPITSHLVNIRISANHENIDAIVDDLLERLPSDWRLDSRSNPYPCRPPNQKESRVYLSFTPFF